MAILPQHIVQQRKWRAREINLKVKGSFSKRPVGPIPAVVPPEHLFASSSSTNPSAQINLKVKGSFSKRPVGPIPAVVPTEHLFASSLSTNPAAATNYGVTEMTSKPPAPLQPPKPTGAGGRNLERSISPRFSKELDRSWLERETPFSTATFDLSSYVPQAGDLVLYYPSAHSAFLDVYPDVWGQRVVKSISRLPLWKRAMKEKLQKKTTSSSQQDWWTEPWAQAIAKADYPLICKVVSTTAEFPYPDPYANFRTVNPTTGKVTWNIPKAKKYKGEGGKKNAPPKTQLRLVVSLKPLTPILPPEVTTDEDDDNKDESSTSENNSTDIDNDKQRKNTKDITKTRSLPPNFSVVTFPTTKNDVDQFLVPFSWAYGLSHSLAVDDEIEIPSSASKGKVLAFRNVGPRFGSMRLEDKLPLIRAFLQQLEASSFGSTSLEDTLRSAFQNKQQKKFLSPAINLFPIQDACWMVRFWKRFLRRSTSLATTEQSYLPSSTTSSTIPELFIILIQSTLPLHKGVTACRASNHRQTMSLSSWDLTTDDGDNGDTHDSDSVLSATGLQHGLSHSLENALRVKIVCTIQDFIETKQAVAEELLTEPSSSSVSDRDYACVVPIKMYFARILARLQLTTSNQRCYYNSAESVVSDIQAIADNILLLEGHNSPVALKNTNQEQKTMLIALINEVKRLVLDVAAQHTRERMRKGSGGGSSKSKNQSRSVPDGINTPFSHVINKSWLQRLGGGGAWVPQSGDVVLYNRKLHSEFIKDYSQSLAKEQCVLPSFQIDSSCVGVYDEKDDTAKDCDKMMDKASSQTANADTQDQQDIPLNGEAELFLSEKVRTCWLHAMIVGVRYTFPRGEESSSFKTVAPILVIELRLPYTWSRNEVYVVCWRPYNIHESDIDNCENKDISCGLFEEKSFLIPAWERPERILDTDILLPDRTAANHRSDPEEIESLRSTSIGRCFNLLKRRCIDGITPDFIDSKFCLGSSASVQHTDDVQKQQRLAAMTPRGGTTRPLPSFEELLVPMGNSSKNSTTKTAVASLSVMSTRGIRKNEDADLIAPLSTMHFLPPWSATLAPQGKGEKVQVHAPPHHETMMAFPTLCLELIRLRVQKGYYRQLAGIVNDLTEAYVTSVLYVLSGPASRRKNRLSVRKIAKHLQAKANNQVAKYTLAAKNKKAGNKNGTLNKPDSNEQDLTKKNTEPLASSHDALCDEEKEWIKRIVKIRRLYATAIVCVNETRHVERVFGLTSRRENHQLLAVAQPSLGPEERARMVAVQRIRYVLSAVGRDFCRNHFKRYGVAKVKLFCDGKIVLPEEKEETQIARFTSNQPQQLVQHISFPSQRFPAGVGASFSQQQISRGSMLPEDAPPPFMVDPSIQFSWKEFEENDNLARCLFGRPGRMFPCVRCQVYKVSFLTCRVRRCHSNPDFGFVENFKNFGGVDGLLQLMQPPKISQDSSGSTASDKAPELSTTNCESEEKDEVEVDSDKTEDQARNSTKESASAKWHIAKENETPRKIAKVYGVDCKELVDANIRLWPGLLASSRLKKGTKIKVSCFDSEEEDVQLDDETKKMEGKESLRAGDEPSDEKALGNQDTARNHSDVQIEDADPSENLEKAESASNLASYLFNQANLLMNTPVRLGETFIKTNFPVDPEDGKYSYCIICGLSGNVLCCDADGCPNVVHTHCIGLRKLPDNDWFCAKCVKEKGLENVESTSEKAFEKEQSASEGDKEKSVQDPVLLKVQQPEVAGGDGTGTPTVGPDKGSDTNTFPKEREEEEEKTTSDVGVENVSPSTPQLRNTGMRNGSPRIHAEEGQSSEENVAVDKSKKVAEVGLESNTVDETPIVPDSDSKNGQALPTTNTKEESAVASYPRSRMFPNVPKRATSAYFAFANERRAEVKAKYPACSNGEISKILSKMWKEAPNSLKQKYRDDEASRWAAYHKAREEQAIYHGTEDTAVQQVQEEVSNKVETPTPPTIKTVPLPKPDISDEEFDKKATELSEILSDLKGFHQQEGLIEVNDMHTIAPGAMDKPIKRGRGRPRKNLSIQNENGTRHRAEGESRSQWEANNMHTKAPEASERPIKRGRGRPRKNSSIQNEIERRHEAEGESPSSWEHHDERKRKRGRPRKTPGSPVAQNNNIRKRSLESENLSSEKDHDGPKRKRGRPRKIPQENMEEPQVNTRKRSVKNQIANGNKENTVGALIESNVQLRIGLTFTKHFEGMGDFQGKIVDLPNRKHPFYVVEYEDGDSEDLSESELMELVDAAWKEETESVGKSVRRRRTSIPPKLFTQEAGAIYGRRRPKREGGTGARERNKRRVTDRLTAIGSNDTPKRRLTRLQRKSSKTVDEITNVEIPRLRGRPRRRF